METQEKNVPQMEIVKKKPEQVDITKLSIEELKVMVYDKSVELQEGEQIFRNSQLFQKMQLLKNDIGVLNQQIAKLKEGK